jgi:hypothetical protein
MTRKILMGLALSTVLVLLLGGVAYATQGESTYLTNPSGDNPHGGYDVNTHKCSVCHAVHHAGADGTGSGSEALLRSDRTNACSYCHISPGVSSKIVYGGDADNYNVADLPNAHNNVGTDGVACTNCHQVHAAASKMTPNAALSRKLLIALPAGSPYDQDADGWVGPELGGPTATDPKDLAVTKWCGRCHTYWPGTPPDPVDSHVLTSAVGSTIAYASSAYCVSCHNSNTVGGVVTTASAYPHFTDGARFLTSAETSSSRPASMTPAGDSQYDGVCLRCHRDGAGSGVGLSF